MAFAIKIIQFNRRVLGTFDCSEQNWHPIASLQRLLDSPDLNQCDVEAYSVTDYIMWSKKNLLDCVGAYSIRYCGDISSREYAKIARWFSENIPGASYQVGKWLGGMSLVHALSLLPTERQVTSKMRGSSERGMERWRAIEHGIG
ncbi:hypothetical protein EDB19DRAFT_1833038 [Suillus lakei]|nr:hypothetical protein EDB19DRAFT_1833038 [Suillus lakei]